MAAPVFTRQLALRIGTGTNSLAIYIAPAGGHTVVRDVGLAASEVATNVALFVQRAGLDYVFFGLPQVEPYTALHWDGRVALAPGDALGFKVTTTGTWSIVATGYVFTS